MLKMMMNVIIGSGERWGVVVVDRMVVVVAALEGRSICILLYVIMIYIAVKGVCRKIKIGISDPTI